MLKMGGMPLWVVIIFLMLWGTAKLIFWVTHRRPLNEKEITRLSQKRTRKYVQKNFDFMPYEVTVNRRFKSSMNAQGKLYRIEEKLSLFPSLVSGLLKGKKHEWVILALATEEKVVFLWANKGVDNQSVAPTCGINSLVDLCKKHDSHTIMRFHNHPNGNISASSQDYKSAEFFSNRVSGEGINWLDFVCGTGRFRLFFKNISPIFYPAHASPESIRKENSQTRKGNYRLHKELGILRRS